MKSHLFTVTQNPKKKKHFYVHREKSFVYVSKMEVRKCQIRNARACGARRNGWLTKVGLSVAKPVSGTRGVSFARLAHSEEELSISIHDVDNFIDM